jgi:hypothetical protein
MAEQRGLQSRCASIDWITEPICSRASASSSNTPISMPLYFSSISSAMRLRSGTISSRQWRARSYAVRYAP